MGQPLSAISDRQLRRAVPASPGSVIDLLFNEPAFGLRPVAAVDKFAEIQKCRWIHIFDHPSDPRTWLAGGEIILTTGASYATSEQLQRCFVDQLAAAGCVALGYSGDPPEAMVHEAERVGLPMFAVPYSVPLAALMEVVTRRVFEEQIGGLRQSLALHHQLLARTVDHTVCSILDTATRYLGRVGLRLLDGTAQVIAESDQGRLFDPIDREELWAVVGSTAHLDRHVVETDQGRRTLCAAQVRVGAVLEAVLVAASVESFDKTAELLFDQTLAAVATVLSRESSRRQVRRELANKLLEGLHDCSLLREGAVRERVQECGLDAGAGLSVLCLPLPEGEPSEPLCTSIEAAVVTCPSAVGVIDDRVYVVTSEEPSKAATDVAKALLARGYLMPIGRSRRYRQIQCLSLAFREAGASVVGKTSGIHGIEDLDVEALLVCLDQAELGDLIIEQIIGPLLATRSGADGQLLATLAAYLRHSCRPGPAAAELLIHRHTLTYRLNRIAELTGRDPRDGDQLLNFAAALALLRRRRDRPAAPSGRPADADLLVAHDA